MALSYIKNVAVVGVRTQSSKHWGMPGLIYEQATGNSGGYITRALVGTGKHTVTALTRAESKSTPPEGCLKKTVDYNDTATLVEALRGQDALIITLNPTAQAEQPKLIQAAADAGVPWVFPNEWGTDNTNQKVAAEAHFGGSHAAILEQIKALGKSSYVAVATGFWYEWSLSIATAYGFDFGKREVTLFDDGRTPMTNSTWPQVGRTVAALLSLPIQSTDAKPGLDSYRNSHVFVKSFTLTQRDMFESVKRVTKTHDADWTIKQEPSKERWAKYEAKFKAGDRSAFGPTLYSRFFFPDEEPGNHEKHRGLANEALGLPVEDLDQATQAAIDRAHATQGKPY